MTTDWDRGVHDPFLRDDLRRCLAGDPGDRFVSGNELAERLRTIPQRRTALAEREAAERAARAEREAAERAAIRRRRFAVILASVAGLIVLLAIALGYGLYREQIQYRKLEREFYYATIAHAQKCIEELRFEPARELLAACPKRYRHWEWGRLQYLCNLDLMTLRGHSNRVYSVASARTASALRREAGTKQPNFGTRKRAANFGHSRGTGLR